ncbi:hypothetical protein [Streptomyces sp. NPDC093225]|uniref:hypothetical protein n=1 Tax=Streptomyces sp. NPDC093225 TaxID=3366034 RepID=UPI0037FE72A9
MIRRAAPAHASWRAVVLVCVLLLGGVLVPPCTAATHPVAGAHPTAGVTGAGAAAAAVAGCSVSAERAAPGGPPGVCLSACAHGSASAPEPMGRDLFEASRLAPVHGEAVVVGTELPAHVPPWPRPPDRSWLCVWRT